MKKYFIKMTGKNVNVKSEYFGYSFEQIIGTYNHHMTYKILSQPERKVHKVTEFNFLDNNNIIIHGFDTIQAARIRMNKLKKDFKESTIYSYKFEIIIVNTTE